MPQRKMLAERQPAVRKLKTSVTNCPDLCQLLTVLYNLLLFNTPHMGFGFKQMSQ